MQSNKENAQGRSCSHQEELSNATQPNVLFDDNNIIDVVPLSIQILNFEFATYHNFDIKHIFPLTNYKCFVLLLLY